VNLMSEPMLGLPQGSGRALQGYLGDFAELIGADRVLVALYDAPLRCASIVAVWVRPGVTARAEGELGAILDPVPEALRQAHLRGEPWAVADAALLPASPVKERLQDDGILSAVVVPMMDGGACMGFVGFDWTRSRRDASDLGSSQQRLFVALLANVLVRRSAEAGQAEAEARLRSISQNFTEGMIYQLLTREGGHRRFTFVSDAVQHLYGITPQAVMADAGALYARLHPDDVARLAHLEAEAGRTLSPFHIEVRALDAAGAYQWASFQSNPRRQGDGSVLWDGVALQVSARKQAEEALRANEERLRLALGATSDAVWDWDLTRGQAYFSTRCYGMLGYEPEAFPADLPHALELLHPEDRDRMESLVVAAIQQGAGFTAECRLRTGQGGWRWLQVRGTVSAWDSFGKPARLSGTNSDVHERKLAELALSVNEERLRAALEATSDAVWDWELATGTLYCSPRWYTMLGYAAGEPQVGLGFIRGHIHPQDAERVEQAARAAILGSGAYAVEARMRCADGSWRWVQTRGSVCARDAFGRALRLAGVNTDIHARKLAEESADLLQAQLLQAQKMESVGRLAGGVAHDFNNMLSVILWYAESALDKAGAGHAIAPDLEQIRQAAERSAELTRQLLAFARKQPVAPKVLDLNAAVGGTLKMLQRMIGEDIQLQWRPGPGLWPVKVDPSQVDQVLANLCVNSRDAIHGSGRIIIETANAALGPGQVAGQPGMKPGDHVLLTVSDDGAGMDPATLALIFEPFFTTKELGKGTGLGLATVYGIVKQNQGFISASSQPGVGTTFKVYLPRHAVLEAVEAAVALPAAAAAAQATILLVEDEPALLTMAQRMLEALGYTVVASTDPAEALRLAAARTEPLDLLVSDVVMPGMNGGQLAQALQRQRPGLKCLFMSGYTADVIAPHGVLDEGMHFMQKPFTRQGLAAKVAQALGR
jgi:PAS domain S-box-containing protein